MSSDTPHIPFQQGDLLVDLTDPTTQGVFTGEYVARGSHIRIELEFPNGTRRKVSLSNLEKVDESLSESMEDRLRAGKFGDHHDLQRLITFEKLKGTLHEVVYSMEAAQIDFYPYQFKPVLKFINSPTERLIIADEVGLGKTIESALIWTELQARKEAKRLLIVCPKILTEKWRDELRTKFQFDARIVEFRDLQQEISELKEEGETHPFVLIASYSGLRPPKSELKLLDSPPDDGEAGSAKTQFLREIKHWNYTYSPFDLVIYDEAHYMKNPATSTFNLGESLCSHNETGVLCVSATPVNNSNEDLRSLLRLIDSDFFETPEMFNQLLAANRPTMQLLNTLASPSFDRGAMESSVAGMAQSTFINESPLFEKLLEYLGELASNPESRSLLAKAQDTTEKLNLLGNYVNRTRRVQVEEKRPIRKVVHLSVEYTEEEMTLYNAILELVRRKCQKEDKRFHIFQVLGLQLRAASCLPVIAEDVKNGKLGSTSGRLEDMVALLEESVGGLEREGVYQGFESLIPADDEWSDVDLTELVKYEFEKNDRKFAKLVQLLNGETDGADLEAEAIDAASKEKVVIFAYYRPTLAYLRRRLQDAGFEVASIHGGVDHEQRWEELARFKDPAGPRILLSSEVGSEGIDLQFCRTLVNYDLPWNPMKVEQRVGRIDRVGQKADRLLIVNFKVKDTVEERLYDRLHSKLLLFANSLGDLEDVIGDEVNNLTADLLSQTLTPQEEADRMEKTELAIENWKQQIETLEESGDTLVALADFVQKKIREDKEKGRYILGEELEDYVYDFFQREFEGTDISYDTPAPHCLRISLSSDARRSLADFIKDDQSLSARPLRQREISLTFRREIYRDLPSKVRKSVHFVNHLSPLVRWITLHNRDHSSAFYNVSALELESSTIPAGVYSYRIDRWLLQGLKSRESLAYAVTPVDGELFDAETSEKVIQSLLRNGKRWEYADPNLGLVYDRSRELADILDERFFDAFDTFKAENETEVLIRKRRAINHWDRLIAQSVKAIETMKADGRKESMIRGRETRLANEELNKNERVQELEKGNEVKDIQEPVAVGVFRVIAVEEE